MKKIWVFIFIACLMMAVLVGCAGTAENFPEKDTPREEDVPCEKDIVFEEDAPHEEDISFEEDASSIDLGQLTDEELITLQDQVQAEIVSRGIEKSARLQAGTYVGGRDLPIGRYILTGAGTGDQSGLITFYSSAKDDNIVLEFIRAEDDFTVYITMEDDDTLELPFPFEATVSSGVVFK